LTAVQIRNAHLATLAANLLFAVNFSMVKYISPEYIKPFGLNLVRVLIAALLFWILFLLKPSRAGIDKTDIPRFLLCGVAGVAINQLLFVKGMTLTTPIHGALLILFTPVFILLLAFVLRTEKMTVLKGVGLLLGIAGASLLIVSRQSAAFAPNILLGDLYIIINAISYACYFILVKPLMLKYKPIHVVRWVFTFGLFLILPFCWGQFSTTDWSAFDGLHLGALSFVVIGATFLPYLLTVYGLRFLSASATGSYIYLQPIFSAIFSMLFFDEALHGYKILAALLIFGGVYLVNRKPNPLQVEPPGTQVAE
jgi:drug/metabolite transporter (DMT)-like permease